MLCVSRASIPVILPCYRSVTEHMDLLQAYEEFFRIKLMENSGTYY